MYHCLTPQLPGLCDDSLLMLFPTEVRIKKQHQKLFQKVSELSEISNKIRHNA
jgi:hypothetical protein